MNKISNKRNISTIIILAIVLLVPGFLYIALNKIGSNQYLKLPIYGEKSLSGKMNRKMGREIPDTIYHHVKPVTLHDADGNEVPFLKDDSTITVVHLFVGVQEGLSNTLFSSIVPVVDRFRNIHKVKFYSISLNPSISRTELKQLVTKYARGLESTWFVARPDSVLFNYVQQNFLIDAHLNSDSTYTYSNNYLLLDTEGRIRGFYDIRQDKEMERLMDEIKVQLVEEARNNPFKVEKK